MEQIILPVTRDKKERYDALLPQINALVQGEPDPVANLANIAAALKQGMDFWWVGFYFVRGKELVLGPFQGPVACTRIGYGKGVCGTAWKERRIILVPDVEQFPGHIACSADSKSEVVIPVWKDNEVIMILDIDSASINDFDEVDEAALSAVVRMVEQFV